MPPKVTGSLEVAETYFMTLKTTVTFVLGLTLFRTQKVTASVEVAMTYFMTPKVTMIFEVGLT